MPEKETLERARRDKRAGVKVPPKGSARAVRQALKREPRRAARTRQRRQRA